MRIVKSPKTAKNYFSFTKYSGINTVYRQYAQRSYCVQCYTLSYSYLEVLYSAEFRIIHSVAKRDCSDGLWSSFADFFLETLDEKIRNVLREQQLHKLYSVLHPALQYPEMQDA